MEMATVCREYCLFCTGTEFHKDEIRARLVYEGVTNADRYLDHNYLCREATILLIKSVCLKFILNILRSIQLEIS